MGIFFCRPRQTIIYFTIKNPNKKITLANGNRNDNLSKRLNVFLYQIKTSVKLELAEWIYVEHNCVTEKKGKKKKKIKLAPEDLWLFVNNIAFPPCFSDLEIYKSLILFLIL